VPQISNPASRELPGAMFCEVRTFLPDIIGAIARPELFFI